jgi:hypothetical protein
MNKPLELIGLFFVAFLSSAMAAVPAAEDEWVGLVNQIKKYRVG